MSRQMVSNSECRVASNGLLVARLARWIVEHPPIHGGDHACSLCYPHGDILVDGFVCSYHEAVHICDCSNAGAQSQRVTK